MRPMQPATSFRRFRMAARLAVLPIALTLLTGCPIPYLNDPPLTGDCEAEHPDEKCIAYGSCVAEVGNRESFCRLSILGSAPPFGESAAYPNYKDRAILAQSACAADSWLSGPQGPNRCGDFADCYARGGTSSDCFKTWISSAPITDACSAL